MTSNTKELSFNVKGRVGLFERGEIYFDDLFWFSGRGEANSPGNCLGNVAFSLTAIAMFAVALTDRTELFCWYHKGYLVSQ